MGINLTSSLEIHSFLAEDKMLLDRVWWSHFLETSPYAVILLGEVLQYKRSHVISLDTTVYVVRGRCLHYLVTDLLRYHGYHYSYRVT